MPHNSADTTGERFEVSRQRLASLAYRLLGSAAEAEDVVQDAYLRWQAADPERLPAPEAWLTKTVTNLAVDRLRSAKARRERAVGVWMPEPLLEGDPMLDPAETAQQRETVSFAVLTLMERLRPVERAVYVLREAFSHSHAEIAAILDISESASQQHALRARRRLGAGANVTSVDRAEVRRVVEAFVEAASSGRTARLVAMLTDDATAVFDGFGLTERLLRFSVPERIAAALRSSFEPTPAKRRLAGGAIRFHAGTVNGAPAIIAVLDGRVAGLGVLDCRDGKVAAVYGIASAPRLARVAEAWRGKKPSEPIAAW
ncbi:sigma-70 family RNA polymerase sigma factor [Glycomyces albidus]|uniref:Sigma-70 family RNA polymerase sigma factor n=1 Tax=Glycomyces albidus TaxID=2656774 RepID=A0A6L5G963_9ACTN|nr:sigma-70 family RNA polymerase sigma factor [Glycomyces albidus]MQM26156.1 sigma-70 family RNA polymerase sigma factor [Glycomyces albidus]